MDYLITPKKKFCVVRRTTFKKENKEIKCGHLFKKMEFILIDPYLDGFLEYYDPKIGHSTSDDDFPLEEEVSFRDIKKKSLIYFSETVNDDEKKKLEKIFNNDEKYFEKFMSLGWSFVDSDTVLWGEIKIEEYGETEYDEEHKISPTEPNMIDEIQIWTNNSKQLQITKTYESGYITVFDPYLPDYDKKIGIDVNNSILYIENEEFDNPTYSYKTVHGLTEEELNNLKKKLGKEFDEELENLGWKLDKREIWFKGKLIVHKY